MTTFDPGAKTGLHVLRNLKSLVDRFFRDQSRGEHHRGIRSVRAGSDRGDDHGAVTKLGARAVRLERRAFLDVFRGEAETSFLHGGRERGFKRFLHL